MLKFIVFHGEILFSMTKYLSAVCGALLLNLRIFATHVFSGTEVYFSFSM